MEDAKNKMEIELGLLESQFNDADNLLKANPPDIADLQSAMENLELQSGEYETALKEYTEVLLKNKKNDDCKAVVIKRNENRKKRLAVKKAVDSIVTSTTPPAGSANPAAVVATTMPPQDIYRVHLPKRELQKFGGDVRHWRSFWASFKEIDGEKVIPDIEKYHYLLQSMVPGSRPYQVVSSYPADGPSYKLARDELADKFGRQKTLIKVYVRDLLKLVVENASENKKSDFTELVTTLTAQIRNLEQLGLTQDKFGEILYPIVESCIPTEVLSRYLQKPAVKEEISEIIEFLNNEVRRFDETVLAQGPFGETSQKKDAKAGRIQSKQPNGNGKPTPTAANFINSTEKNGCGFCGGKHPTQECFRAIGMSLEERKEALKKTNCCFKCLGSDHNARKCTGKVMCIMCKGKHHTLMCFQHETNPENLKSRKSKEFHDSHQDHDVIKKEEKSSASLEMANYIQRPEVLLQTLKVKIFGKTGYKVVRAMIDSGSQATYITRSLARDLQLDSLGKERVIHQTFGGSESDEVVHPVYRITVGGTKIPYEQRCTFNASAIPKIAHHIISPPQGKWLKECQEMGVMLSDEVGVDSDIDILIGNDISPYLRVGLRSQALPCGLVVTETKLGWILEGKIRGSEKRNNSKAMMMINMQVTDKDLSHLWSLETLGICDDADKQSRAELEEAALDHFRTTVTQDDSGRYQVHLPWLEGHPALPPNKQHAVARLQKTTKDLIRDNRLGDYNDIFKSWKDEGIIEVVPPNQVSSRVHYLPHRAVYKENSTTPTRPVFNASSKIGKQVSMNQCLEIGPNLLEQIPSILTGFRLEKVGVISDIRKAFLQIKVAEADRDCMRFLWWKDVNDRKEIVEYRHCRVVFGVSSSPFLLGAVIQHHLSQHEDMYAETIEKLRSGFYVDNCVVSVDSMEKAKQFEDDATKLFAKAQMELRGWEFGPVEEEKEIGVLGLVWNTKEDTLQFEVAKVEKKHAEIATKRTLLSCVSSVYDPLGLLSPFTVKAKQLFKRVCLDPQKFHWDTTLPVEYVKELEDWIKQSELIRMVKIPRWLSSDNSYREDWSLHTFSDASKDSYATCVFLRINSDPMKILLVQSRARVTPEKGITIPRAELLSCLIGARLTAKVKADIGLPSIPVTYWSDSTTALTWIKKTDGVWARFVNNRVDEIRKLTHVESWKHVPGEMNPADLPSRGCNMEKLLKLKWWEGPQWLRYPEENFPNSTPHADQELVEAEKKKTVTSALASLPPKNFIDDLARFGDYHKLLRIIAYCRRFLKKSSSSFIKERGISSLELEEAEYVVIRHIQQSSWGDRPPIGGFHAEVKNGVVRVITRLVNSNDPSSFKKPVLLPGNHPIVKMMIYKEHSLSSHAGTQFMQSLLREKYWITNNRRNIGNVVRSCPVCRIHSARRCQVPEAPLPANRLNATHCFDVTGVDLAGPLMLKNGNKVWIVLFTCAVYRAVHLEIVMSLSTHAFVNALRKFVSRRGRPSKIYSDNGTNFRGCVNWMKSLDWNKVQQYAVVNKIQWIFNPPTAAWWGGFWERLVGLMKKLLRKVLGSRVVDAEALEVYVMEVEAVMNERPLTYISEDPADLRAIKPSHFLRDLPVACLPELDAGGAELTRKWRHVQRQKEELRKRFRSEYLDQLLGNAKSCKSISLRPGDVVLVEVDNKKRLDWPIGVIEDVYPGKDGIYRTARLRTNHGELVRPFQRLFPLEIQNAEKLPKVNIPKEIQPADCEEDDPGEELENIMEFSEAEPVVLSRFGRQLKKPVRFNP